MDSNYRAYDHVASFARIDEILALPRGNFEEVSELPDRDRLTYTNGFYAQHCSAMFVDIRGSSKLPDKYNRPALAKLYRAYLSEMVAILNSHSKAREINIVGDGAWAVFSTPQKDHINEIFDIAAKANSLVKVLNYKLAKAGYAEPICIGIGMSYGRALMIKAGFKGSGLADVVYMGDVVNHAAKLASKGSLDGNPPIMIGNVFQFNLKDKYKEFTTKDYINDCYTAGVVNTSMEAWYNTNCK